MGDEKRGRSGRQESKVERGEQEAGDFSRLYHISRAKSAFG